MNQEVRLARLPIPFDNGNLSPEFSLVIVTQDDLSLLSCCFIVSGFKINRADRRAMCVQNIQTVMRHLSMSPYLGSILPCAAAPPTSS
jgi:hypothetical protein